jgi:glycerol transport system ATP-binding protein
VVDQVLQIQPAIDLTTVPHLANLPDGDYEFALRPDHLMLQDTNSEQIGCQVEVELAEISASETYLHVSGEIGTGLTIQNWVVHILSIMNLPSGSKINIYLPLHDMFVFSLNGHYYC